MTDVPSRAAFVLIARTEADAARLAASIDGAVHLPAWDVAPLSDKRPSAAIEALRMKAVATLDAAARPRVVCSALAAAQALPPADLASSHERIAVGDLAEPLATALVRLGYRPTSRVDAPGTFARYGLTTDLWCADRHAPVRLRHETGRVGAIEPCDAATLRVTGERLDALRVPLCTSNPAPDGGEPGPPHDWTFRHERRTLHDVVGKARILALPGAVERGAAIIAEIDAEDAERAASHEGVPPRHVWLSAEEWTALTHGAKTVEVEPTAAVPTQAHHEFAEEPLGTGDHVVHLHHGIGIYRGVERVAIDGREHEALRIEFADGDAMVPAHEADLVWRYGDGDGDVALGSLGDEDWPATIAALSRELREAATHVRRVRAERDARDAPRVSWDRGALRVLEADWHVPTPDQATALAEVRGDMDGSASGVETSANEVRPPMDRLLCGDTGFGKTEIIVRAAAATVEAGHQAIVAAPTTILADQHGVTFTERFEPLGMTVRVLTGATPDAERAETLALMEAGEPMVVIGTHLLAGEGVVPGRPGLLVLDEEQRFGAAIKTALRAKGPSAHVLATTATPIPRTTMAALVGLRTVSTLRTPPPGRRGVRTEVVDWDARRLRRALKAERDAGGRSFVVVPRIEDMGAVEKGLAALTPDLSVAVLHGRLDDAGTAERLRAYRAGEVDVLLATTVIETGIDVPEANLMVVLDAGRFGVGQLHQLRGRVGRGERRGRALLFDSCAWIDCARGARDRLALLCEHDGLGAGFTLAARDLAQRGAGDPFGDEQTGHTHIVGVELYARLMREALQDIAGGVLDGSRAALAVAGALVPADYVPQADMRARLYGRLAKATDVSEVRDIADEMADRFGPLANAAIRFIEAATASARARALGVTAVTAGDDAIALDLTPERADALSRRVRGSAIEWKGERVVLRSAKADPARIEALLEAFERADEAAAADDEAERAKAA